MSKENSISWHPYCLSRQKVPAGHPIPLNIPQLPCLVSRDGEIFGVKRSPRDCKITIAAVAHRHTIIMNENLLESFHLCSHSGFHWIKRFAAEGGHAWPRPDSGEPGR